MEKGFALFIGHGNFIIILGRRDFHHPYYTILETEYNIYTDYLKYIF